MSADYMILKVGRTGFEPATPWSQTTYSTGLNYLPNVLFPIAAKAAAERVAKVMEMIINSQKERDSS